MASPMEYEGRNVKKAVQMACRELGIDADDLKYDVISYGSSGIFGLVGTKKARIRVIIPKQKRSVESQETPNGDIKPDPPSDTRNENLILEQKAEEKYEEPEPEPILVSDNMEVIDPKNDEDPDTDVSGDDSEASGREALQRIVNSITSDTEILSRQNQGQIEYDVKGGNTAIIIGKRGQTLEAIQYLVEKIVNKKRGHRIRVHIDAGDYMLKRRQNLEQIAARVANKAKNMGRPASLGQLNPHDRRIVHMTLRGDNDVWTKSLGDGHLRKLVVYPKRRSHEERGRGSQ